MSAASGRMFKILWITLLAALGITVARPDVSGADDESARVIPASIREFGGMPIHPPVGRPVERCADPVDAIAPAAVARNVTYAPHQIPEIPSYPGMVPHPEYTLLPPTSSSQAITPYPADGPHPSSPQSLAPAIVPAQAAAPSDPPSPDRSPVPESSKNQPAAYIVTAYYLNVRAEPDKTSPIRGLLERGDRVGVVGKTENGWLELEDGLFIHGAYAEPAGPESDPQPETAKNAGREVTIASASPPALPEHAIYEPGKLGESGGPAPLSKKVESSSGMTEEDVAKLLEGTALEGHGLEEAILGIEEEYGINALFTIAVMKLESGNGKSKLAREKNNLFGLNATGGGNAKAYRFETKSDSVYKFGSIIAKSYLAKGYSTLEKVGKKYCPANPKWASLVESIMKRDHRKLVRTAV